MFAVFAVAQLLSPTAASESASAKLRFKKEAPMAEPSQDYLPPRIDAPYATFTPLIKTQNFAASDSNPNYFLPKQYDYPSTTPTPSFAPTEPTYSSGLNYRNSEQLVAPITGNEIGHGFPQPTASFSSFRGASSPTVYRTEVDHPGNFGKYGNFGGDTGSLGGNSFGFSSGSFPNRLNHGSNLFPTTVTYRYAGQNAYPSFGGSGNVFGSSLNGGSSFGYPNGFGNSFANAPTSAALTANKPAFPTVTKGLGHYASLGSQSLSSLNHQPMKNSKPIALQPAHLVRKPPPNFDTPQNSFRPSAFLGSSVLTSTPEFVNAPTLTSLGTINNQYFPPPIPEQSQYVTSSRAYLSPAVSSLPLESSNNIASYRLPEKYAPSKPPGIGDVPRTSYGVPIVNNGLTFSRSDPPAPYFASPYSNEQITQQLAQQVIALALPQQ